MNFLVSLSKIVYFFGLFFSQIYSTISRAVSSIHFSGRISHLCNKTLKFQRFCPAVYFCIFYRSKALMEWNACNYVTNYIVIWIVKMYTYLDSNIFRVTERFVRWKQARVLHGYRRCKRKAAWSQNTTPENINQQIRAAAFLCCSFLLPPLELRKEDVRQTRTKK